MTGKLKRRKWTGTCLSPFSGEVIAQEIPLVLSLGCNLLRRGDPPLKKPLEVQGYLGLGL